MPTTGGSGGGTGSGGRGGSSNKVQISYCFRAPSSLRPVFGEEGLRDKDRLYSEAEVLAALASYAAAQGEWGWGGGWGVVLAAPASYAAAQGERGVEGRGGEW